MVVAAGQDDSMSVEEEAARGEIDRLRSMTGLGLAVEVMRAWRADPGPVTVPG